MTKDEALRLALEALEDLGNHDRVCPQWPTYAEPENYPKCNCGYDQAITTIKESLAQLQPCLYVKDIGGNFHLLKEKGHTENCMPLADDGWNHLPPSHSELVEKSLSLEAKDEPVATKNNDGVTLHLGWDDLPVGTKLYAVPPQRTWIGLTDEDIALIDWESLITRKDCVKAIEAKLKEKNT